MNKDPTVLLVEDEPLLGELMTEALIDQGFEVHAAPDARDALRHLLSGADVDILFTDVDLGNGMDGATLAQLVHEMRPQLPIVYTSGRRMDKFQAVPGSAFLPKPYSIDDVGNTLERLIRSAARKRQPADVAPATPSSRRWPDTAPASGCDSFHR